MFEIILIDGDDFKGRLTYDIGDTRRASQATVRLDGRQPTDRYMNEAVEISVSVYRKNQNPASSIDTIRHVTLISRCH